MAQIRSCVLIAALLAPLPALAVEPDEIVTQLRAQGFNQITVNRTFLGRIKIEAQASKLHREIVLNPKTGEILRDYTDVSDSESRYAGSDRGTAPGRTAVDSGLTSPTGIGTSTSVDAGVTSGITGGITGGTTAGTTGSVGPGDATSPGGGE